MIKNNKNLLAGWQKVKLEEVAEIVMGQSPSGESYNEIGDGLPFYQGVTEFNEKFVSIKKYTNQPTKIVEKNTILFSVRAPVGRVNFIKWKACIGRGNAGMVMKNGNQDFLYFLLKFLEKEIQNYTSGTVFTSISGKELKNILVTIPENPEEQKSIAKILSSFDDKIELLREQNETLEKMGEVIFKEWFGKYKVDDDLPEGWRVGRLSEIAEFINGYAFKSKDLLKEYSVDTYKIFKMGDIKKGGGFNPDKTKSYIKKDDFVQNNKYILKSGDLLMSMTDMKDAVSLLGHTALMIYDNEYVVNQRVGLIRANNEINIEYPYLYLLTNNKDFISNLRGRANSGVQINLSTGVIKSSEVIIADKDFNKNFNEKVKPLFEKIKNNSEQIQTLSKTRDILLPRLMKGEVLLD